MATRSYDNAHKVHVYGSATRYHKQKNRQAYGLASSYGPNSTRIKAIILTYSAKKSNMRILVKYEGNGSPRFDGKTWEEDSINVVVVNDHPVSTDCGAELKAGDKIVSL